MDSNFLEQLSDFTDELDLKYEKKGRVKSKDFDLSNQKDESYQFMACGRLQEKHTQSGGEISNLTYF